MKKKILSLLMSLVMIAGLAVVPTGTADAASKRGAVVPMSFWDSIRWEDEFDWDANWDTNSLWVSVWGKENVSLSSKTTLSFTLYLSKYMFDKDAGEDGHHQLGMSIGMDISDENWEWMGKMRSTDDLMIVKYNGKYSVSATVFGTEKEADTSAWASIKEVEDFLVLTVKDYPLGENLTDWNDDGPVLTPVDFNKKYNINMGLDILPHNGVGGDALIIWDDVEVKDSGNVIYSEDFQYYENCGYLENRTKNESGDYRGRIYTTSLLSLKSKKANIKVGKSTKINSTSIAGTTVTYKSNKPKVASVDKNGNVKGLKKGKAVISVSCCGKTLKYTVTVK